MLPTRTVTNYSRWCWWWFQSNPKCCADYSVLITSPLITAPADDSHSSLATAPAMWAVFCRLLWRPEQSEQPEQYLATPATIEYCRILCSEKVDEHQLFFCQQRVEVFVSQLVHKSAVYNGKCHQQICNYSQHDQIRNQVCLHYLLKAIRAPALWVCKQNK